MTRARRRAKNALKRALEEAGDDSALGNSEATGSDSSG
jgi:hypothetical protein